MGYSISMRNMKDFIELIDNGAINIHLVSVKKANKLMIDLLIFKKYIDINKNTYIDWDEHEVSKNMNSNEYVGLGNRLMKDGELIDRNYQDVFNHLLYHTCDGNKEKMLKKLDILRDVATKYLNAGLNLQ